MSRNFILLMTVSVFILLSAGIIFQLIVFNNYKENTNQRLNSLETELSEAKDSIILLKSDAENTRENLIRLYENFEQSVGQDLIPSDTWN